MLVAALEEPLRELQYESTGTTDGCSRRSIHFLRHTTPPTNRRECALPTTIASKLATKCLLWYLVGNAVPQKLEGVRSNTQQKA